jgi:putative membrane protein
MLEASMTKNDPKAKWVIAIFSIIITGAITLLSRYKLNVDLGFNVHIFATANAFINSAIAVLLVAALIAVKNQKYLLHKRLMMTALVLSIVFLVSYVAHHLLAGEAKFGDANHDGIVSDDEKTWVGATRTIYFFILGTHILLAALIMPFVLFTSYRALTADFPAHKKLARITWPLWFYVAVTGPVVYWMISPYYS